MKILTKQERNEKIITLFSKGTKLKDIAKKLNMPESTVKSVIYAGKEIPKNVIPIEKVNQVKNLAQFGDYSLAEISQEVELPVLEIQRIFK